MCTNILICPDSGENIVRPLQTKQIAVTNGDGGVPRGSLARTAAHCLQFRHDVECTCAGPMFVLQTGGATGALRGDRELRYARRAARCTIRAFEAVQHRGS